MNKIVIVSSQFEEPDLRMFECMSYTWPFTPLFTSTLQQSQTSVMCAIRDQEHSNHPTNLSNPFISAKSQQSLEMAPYLLTWWADLVTKLILTIQCYIRKTLEQPDSESKQLVETRGMLDLIRKQPELNNKYDEKSNFRIHFSHLHGVLDYLYFWFRYFCKALKNTSIWFSILTTEHALLSLYHIL